MSETIIHVSTMAKNCYALSWSYGEICVHCNCCGKFNANEKAVLSAKLEYHEQQLQEALNFNGWFDSDPKIVKIQKENKRKDIEYHRSKIAEIKKILDFPE